MAKGVARVLILKEDVRMEPLFHGQEAVLHDGMPVYSRSDTRQYLDITTDDKYGKVALSILRGRFATKNKKYFLHPPIEPAPCQHTQEEWEAMEPTDVGYAAAAEEVQRAAEDRRRYEGELRSYNALVRCITDGDERLAVAILEERRSLPNEGYEIVILMDEYPGC